MNHHNDATPAGTRPARFLHNSHLTAGAESSLCAPAGLVDCGPKRINAILDEDAQIRAVITESIDLDERARGEREIETQRERVAGEEFRSKINHRGTETQRRRS